MSNSNSSIMQTPITELSATDSSLTLSKKSEEFSPNPKNSMCDMLLNIIAQKRNLIV